MLFIEFLHIFHSAKHLPTDYDLLSKGHFCLGPLGFYTCLVSLSNKCEYIFGLDPTNSLIVAPALLSFILTTINSFESV